MGSSPMRADVPASTSAAPATTTRSSTTPVPAAAGVEQPHQPLRPEGTWPA